jgi:hypothetical protein
MKSERTKPKMRKQLVVLKLVSDSLTDKNASELIEELSLREWKLLKVKMASSSNELIVSTEFSGTNSALVASHFQEELAEAASGVLESIAGMRVEIVSTSSKST